MNKIEGRVWLFGDHVNTDQIISTKYMLLTSKSEMAEHAFESIERNFSQRFEAGDIIIGGINFGCGSAREQAPEVLKELGAGAIIAHSFNMTFFRNAINIGIPAIVCPNINLETAKDDEITVALDEGLIINNTTGKEINIQPYPDIIRDIINCSGLVNYYFKNRKERVV